MRLTQKLGELITTYMAVPGHVPEPKPESDFVISGLRAANGATPIVRRKILSDVSDILDCKAEDLEFLFSDYAMPVLAAASYEVMVPDFQTQLMAIAE